MGFYSLFYCGSVQLSVKVYFVLNTVSLHITLNVSNIIDEFKKFAILKKGIGIESQNLCKQFNDQKTIQTRWNSTVAIEQKVDSKAFAIPILTARL